MYVCIHALFFKLLVLSFKVTELFIDCVTLLNGNECYSAAQQCVFAAHIQLHMLWYFLSVFSHLFLYLYAYTDTADTEYLCVFLCFSVSELLS